MLKKVQPKVWWMAIAVLVILLISWGLVRKNKADSPDVAVSGKSVKNLDPVRLTNPYA